MTPDRCEPGRSPLLKQRRDERGAAVTDFVMVSVLLMLVFVLTIQVGLALWTRNTLIAAAQEGARVAARADSSLAEGEARTRDVVAAQLADRYADDVTASTDVVGGVQVVVVTVRAPLPVLGPFGPDRALEVRGRAYVESQ